MNLQTRPLSDELGIEIFDINLRELDTDGISSVREIWQDNPLVLIRGQSMNDVELERFFYGIGDPLTDVTRRDGNSRHTQYVVLISNLHTAKGERLGVLGDGEVVWHMDQCYRKNPATGSLFYAVEMPPRNHTMWASLQAAYDALDAETRAKIEGRDGLFRYQMYQDDVTDEALKREIEAKTPDVWHPLVLTQPHNGRRTLYIDPKQTIEIKGLDDEESEELLQTLKSHVLQPQFIYSHEWHIGDVMLWDNARVLHRREDFDPKFPRLAKRLTCHLPTHLFAHPNQGRQHAAA